MTPAPSPFSPLGFTRAYQTYRAENAAIPFPDSRFLAAARFWTRHAEFLSSDAYSTFWREDLPPLLATAEARQFEDLDPGELAEIATFVASLDSARIESKIAAAELWELAARKWFYVGEADRALKCLVIADLELSNPQSEIRNPQSTVSALLDQLGADESNQKLHDWLVRFDADWRATWESGHTNLATCVLVERDAAGHPIRGRLRTLEARVEPLAKSHDSDEVVFGHQLRAADDPQVRGAYAALAAMRNTESNALQSAIRIPQSTFFRARFTFADSGRESYGGDSLGFACLVAAYGDWWSKDLHRERRLISAGTALTGALNADSSAESVSESPLAKKVERVFFSPLTSLVVPKSNRDTAETEVARLHEQYPARRLRILTAERATDLITDGNIMIPERVCLGEYAVRAAAKYSRSVKVQVPMLAILGYLLVCLVFPEAWVGFDRQTHRLKLSINGITAVNVAGSVVWQYQPESSIDTIASLSVVGNLDSDSANEACVLLQRARGIVSSLEGRLVAFDNDGSVLFERSGIILNQYPGDTLPLSYYQSHALDILSVGARRYILTVVSNDDPGRTHIRIWTAAGDSAGWYINAGYSCAPGRYAIEPQSHALFVIGINNRMKSACLFAISLDSSRGASPPYVDSTYDLSHIAKGNQLAYAILPRTDLLSAKGAPYSRPYRMVTESGILRADLDEIGKGTVTDYGAIVSYYVDLSGRVLEVRCDDLYRAAWARIAGDRKLPPIDWGIYQKSLAASVTYWTDTGWSRSPTD